VERVVTELIVNHGLSIAMALIVSAVVLAFLTR
jgi:hypothetical protein